MNPLALAAVALALVGCTSVAVPPNLPAPTTTSVPAPADEEGIVTRIVDGDTINVDLDGEPKKIRVLFLDTPEVYGGVECGGREATAFAKDTIPLGGRVRLVRDPTQADIDRYQRLLRYVTLTDGRDYTETALHAGTGTYIEYAGHGVRTEALKAAEQEARTAGRGMWGACPS